ncbi:hypothetical protein BDP27DRAFT_1362216 [Rhodocollybia butyracea]|uniref:Uncharacterized protein n=1 Tax=Rhodocollybia butyracea TaxID=206335 RepID=A0A9P5PZC3_9AGAR|nr:hypothetical protein BDP27DRAFT_1362216 [Rhodocollybia butyracea]
MASTCRLRISSIPAQGWRPVAVGMDYWGQEQGYLYERRDLYRARSQVAKWSERRINSIQMPSRTHVLAHAVSPRAKANANANGKPASKKKGSLGVGSLDCCICLFPLSIHQFLCFRPLLETTHYQTYVDFETKDVEEALDDDDETQFEPNAINVFIEDGPSSGADREEEPAAPGCATSTVQPQDKAKAGAGGAEGDNPDDKNHPDVHATARARAIASANDGLTNSFAHPSSSNPSSSIALHRHNGGYNHNHNHNLPVALITIRSRQAEMAEKRKLKKRRFKRVPNGGCRETRQGDQCTPGYPPLVIERTSMPQPVVESLADTKHGMATQIFWLELVGSEDDLVMRFQFHLTALAKTDIVVIGGTLIVVVQEALWVRVIRFDGGVAI